MKEQCQQPQAHPERCGCVPAGTEQVSSAWLAQLRAEYRQFGDEVGRLREVVAAKDAEIAELRLSAEVAAADANEAERELHAKLAAQGAGVPEETDQSVAADAYWHIAEVIGTEQSWSVQEHVEWMRELLQQASDELHDVPESAVGGSDTVVELCRRLRLCLAGKAPGYLGGLPAAAAAPQPVATAYQFDGQVVRTKDGQYVCEVIAFTPELMDALLGKPANDSGEG